MARGESSSASATARTPRWPGALRLSGCRHALTTMPEPASGARGRSRRGPPQRRLRRRRDDVPAGDTRRAHTYTPTSTNANTRTCRLAHCALPRLILCGERARQPLELQSQAVELLGEPQAHRQPARSRPARAPSACLAAPRPRPSHSTRPPHAMCHTALAAPTAPSASIPTTTSTPLTSPARHASTPTSSSLVKSSVAWSVRCWS